MACKPIDYRQAIDYVDKISCLLNVGKRRRRRVNNKPIQFDTRPYLGPNGERDVPCGLGKVRSTDALIALSGIGYQRRAACRHASAASAPRERRKKPLRRGRRSATANAPSTEAGGGQGGRDPSDPMLTGRSV